MTSKKNKNRFGLSRYIPPEIELEIRRRSKFGCVICRGAVTHYEHINPEFKDAEKHDPTKICCLCGSCHDKVTRRIYSKAYVAKRYTEVQQSSVVKPARDFFDFHSGEASLLVGGLKGTSAPSYVFSVYGQPIFQVLSHPKANEGAIYARFTDKEGQDVFRIDGNQWLAFTEAWDVQVKGQRITVLNQDQLVALRLRVEPPGGIAIEHLDMRYGPAHLMATEHAILIGKYLDQNVCAWVTANIEIMQSSESSVFVSVHQPQLERISMGHPTGVAWPQIGLSIASKCGFLLSECVTAIKSLDHVREYFFKSASQPGLSQLIDGTHFLLLPDKQFYTNTTHPKLYEFLRIHQFIHSPENLVFSEQKVPDEVIEEIPITPQSTLSDKAVLRSFLLKNQNLITLDQKIVEFTGNELHLDADNLERHIQDLKCWKITTVQELDEVLKINAKMIISFYKEFDKRWIQYLENNPQKKGSSSSPRGISITYLLFLLAVMKEDKAFIQKYVNDVSSVFDAFQKAKDA
ncbi:hypothetical protein A6770_28345 [Nostoc minutum NIES-26]|uniref:HNH endonuclease n=1 Tax=Nostoc minutum NIES-26 TaxID=1844469 RepID=A0A367QJL7_9NOSO|nr:hypothetical protein A6770_28345 [Nostoc minutum NIES-26]